VTTSLLRALSVGDHLQSTRSTPQLPAPGYNTGYPHTSQLVHVCKYRPEAVLIAISHMDNQVQDISFCSFASTPVARSYETRSIRTGLVRLRAIAT
jgi:hypothetical protein